jgi:cytochrome P450
MLMLNPPTHAGLRRLVSRSFTAQRVASMRDNITRLADELCEPLNGTVEFVDAVAFPFPVTVIGELLGIPAADRAMFQPLVKEWTSVLEILNPLAADAADAAAVQIRPTLASWSEHAAADPPMISSPH